MQQNHYSNPCTRCGKQRVVSRTWKEVIETVSGVVITQINQDTICPDRECQKIVNKELKVQKDKRDKARSDKEKRVLDQKKTNLRNKKKK